MDLQTALASLAAQHPSTPIDLGIELCTEEGIEPAWQAQVTIYLSDEEQPTVAFGEGPTPDSALTDLLQALLRVPIR